MLLLLPPLVIGAACTDAALSTLNQPPTAEITSPADGAEIDAGVPFEATGIAGDPNATASTLFAKWSLDGVEVCPSTAPADDGSTACTVTLTAAQSTLTLTVSDAHAAATEATVNLTSCTGAWFADLDGDGYGDAASTSSACAQPTGYVADGTDCDDYEAAANPGLSETCGDLIDNNCNGHADEGCLGSNCFDDTDIIDNLHYFQTLGSLRSTDAADATGAYQDDYEMQVTAGSELAFHAWSEDVDTRISLYDADCALYDESSDGARNTNAFLQARIPTDGIWTVVVTTDGAAAEGSYVFEVIDDKPTVGANCGLNTYSLDVLSEPWSDSYSGSLASGDQLWSSDVGEGFYYDDAELYAFYGDTLVSTEESEAFDPVMSLFDPDCYIVTYDTDSGGGTTAQITTSVERTGIYTLAPWGTYSYSTGAYVVTSTASF